MKPVDPVLLLKSTPLFADVNGELLRETLDKHNCTVRRAAAGETLGGETEPRALGVLLSGRATILSADRGRTVILRTLRAVTLFGAAALFCPDGAPLSRVEAVGACEYLLIPENAVRALLRADETFLGAYLAFLAGRVEFLNRKIRCFTAGSAQRRLALWLASEEGDEVTLPASLSALSDMLDIGRASLYRALDALEAQSLITREGREITIRDRATLMEKYQ